jgi:hypothetical protein
MRRAMSEFEGKAENNARAELFSVRPKPDLALFWEKVQNLKNKLR